MIRDLTGKGQGMALECDLARVMELLKEVDQSDKTFHEFVKALEEEVVS